MSDLALRTGSINLGQGFPDFDGPVEIKAKAQEAIDKGFNQYPPGLGIAPLRESIALHQRLFYDLEFSPANEILVTAGATEAIAASLLSLLEVGDEVVVFEPYFDSYAACISMAGGVIKPVRLYEPDWTFSMAELEAAISPRSKAILFNSPHNPTGKVFSKQEIETIAAICVEHDLIAITDEVYEHLIFQGEHYPLVKEMGMRDRTITISSAAKTFSFTGWKIGWICSTPELTQAVKTSKQFLTFSNGTPFQHAIAYGLGEGDGFTKEIVPSLSGQKATLETALKEVGFEVCQSDGTYFVTTDISSKTSEDGVTFCHELPRRCGVVAVPMTGFYSTSGIGTQLVRWAFCKRQEVIDQAAEKLTSNTLF